MIVRSEHTNSSKHERECGRSDNGTRRVHKLTRNKMGQLIEQMSLQQHKDYNAGCFAEGNNKRKRKSITGVTNHKPIGCGSWAYGAGNHESPPPMSKSKCCMRDWDCVSCGVGAAVDGALPPIDPYPSSFDELLEPEPARRPSLPASRNLNLWSSPNPSSPSSPMSSWRW